MIDEEPTAELTPEQLTLVAEALSEVRFLAAEESPRGVTTSSSSAHSSTIPPDVWVRISASLEAESAAGQPRLASVTTLRSRRRWLPGVAAAAVAVIAVGVGAAMMRPAAVTVADAPAAAPVPATNIPADARKSAAPADAAAMSAEVLANPMVGGTAPTTRSMIMPTRMLMSSGTQYTSTQLDTQIDGLLSQVGASTPELMSAMPTPAAVTTVGTTGFTADLNALRDCITGIMHSHSASALIVDRATFDGGDAGIVIVPQAQQIDVWIVGPECSSTAPRVLRHLLHAWSHAGTR
jgi:hypothetical protein